MSPILANTGDYKIPNKLTCQLAEGILAVKYYKKNLHVCKALQLSMLCYNPVFFSFMLYFETLCGKRPRRHGNNEWSSIREELSKGVTLIG